ncbi:hypothetical protein MNBD_NITROSPINAE02-1402 [hydrothermal vent metagenome]|uniref:Glycosyltransferase 2-like domain-containing protein n=1 Tax=hydrothermal vent metagenome TaxID=652676 RepID=A0A3B1CI59_9ZZZZ
MKKLCLLILQYNSSDMTLKALESIKKYEGDRLNEYRIVIMDNASKNPRQEAITTLYPFVEYIQYEENLGFAKAHNRVWDSIEEKWTLLMNNDCVLLNNAIHKTMTQAEESRADFGTCALYNEDMTPQINYAPLLSPFRRIMWEMTGFNKYVWPRLKSRRKKSTVGFISGTFLLIKTELFKEAGKFDESYFMYTEDLDLMFRLDKMGARGCLFTQGRLIHSGGQSASRRWGNDEIARMRVRQCIETMKRHFPKWQVWLWLRLNIVALSVLSRLPMFKEGMPGAMAKAYRERGAPPKNPNREPGGRTKT